MVTARTKCVLSTVGPYTRSMANPWSPRALEAGTDYVDLSGEVLWMKEMIGKYSGQAKKSTGARIVHSCGFRLHSISISAFSSCRKKPSRQFGAPCPRVRGRMRAMQGTFSGGTAASGAATMAQVQKNPALLADLMNPFSLTGGFAGPEQPKGNKVMEEDGVWIAPFVMATINTKNIHRSNALLGHAYGEDFVYDEMMMTGPGESGKAMAEAVASMEIGGKDGPKPGEGPSKEERENGFYDYLAIGTAANGDSLKIAVKGDKDPGYGSTSKMLSESAICLVTDAKDLPGGIYTPAPAMGALLRKRLIDNAGLTFTVEA